MSDKNLARRVSLKLKFKGIKVPEDINKHIQSVSFTDEEEDAADDFQLTYDDRESKMAGDWVDVTTTTTTKKVTTQVAPAAEQKETTKRHVVQRGETLSALAKKYLGSADKYKEIAQKNRVKNPDLIYVGQVLTITIPAKKDAKATENTTKTETKTETKTVTTKTTVKPTVVDGKRKSKRYVTASLVQQNWNGNGKDVTLECGKFEIDSIDISGPPDKITLKSTSLPYNSKLRTQKKTKAWEKTTLKAIAGQIASAAGMKLMYESKNNPSYGRKEQIRISDIAFLKKLCKAAGQALKVTCMTIVIYDAKDYDAKPHVMTLKKGSGDIINYKLNSKLTDTAYTSCHVKWTDTKTKKTIEYTYTPDGKKGTGQTLEIKEKVTSKDAAKKLAMKRLREKNTQEYTATFEVVGNIQLVAGATVKLKGFQEFDQKYKIKKATHKITGGYTTQIELKQVLEGY